MDIAGETNLLKLQMPLIVGTVPLQREFSKLEPVTAKEYKDQALPLIPQKMETKYKKLRKLCCIYLSAGVKECDNLFYNRKIPKSYSIASSSETILQKNFLKTELPYCQHYCNNQ